MDFSYQIIQFVNFPFFFTNLGYIFGGGALCMELLTPEGWSPTYTIEGVIMQIAATMAKGHAEVVSKSAPEKYSMQGAREGFANVLRIHKNGKVYCFIK